MVNVPLVLLSLGLSFSLGILSTKTEHQGTLQNMHCSGKAWDHRVVVTLTKATEVIAKIRQKRFSYEAAKGFVSEFDWTSHSHYFLNGLLGCTS